MIRSAFLRRMAQVAMAGMLGAELMLRAPKVDKDCGFVQGVTYFNVGDNVAGRGIITAVDIARSTITVEWS